MFFTGDCKILTRSIEGQACFRSPRHPTMARSGDFWARSGGLRHGSRRSRSGRHSSAMIREAAGYQVATAQALARPPVQLVGAGGLRQRLSLGISWPGLAPSSDRFFCVVVILTVVCVSASWSCHSRTTLPVSQWRRLGWGYNRTPVPHLSPPPRANTKEKRNRHHFQMYVIFTDCVSPRQRLQ
jgi:hypothetical protein